MSKRSPLAPTSFPEMPAIAGVRLGHTPAAFATWAGTTFWSRKWTRERPSQAFSPRSRTAAAPVEWCRRALAGGRARVLVVNSGNANAFTGGVGESAVSQTIEAARGSFSADSNEVFIASTGVIGERLPVEKIVDALGGVRETFSETTWETAARAIMTTDTFPKGSVRRTKVGDAVATICGIAKGSGMIAPNMATMLAFVFTDAAISPGALQVLLSSAVDRSFNCITVDGDTSTSDTLLLFATGASGGETLTDPADPRLQEFRAALDDVTLDLAHQVVRDGEGATKFVAITVSGAEHDAAARRIGLSIANSPLVKTAIAGEDANWGRIVMAVGKSGEKADRDKLSISIGDVEITRHGQRRADYDEAPVAAHIKGTDMEIAVDVGIGDRQGANLDLRSHPRLHRYQCRLPVLIPVACRRKRVNPTPRFRWFWWRRWR